MSLVVSNPPNKSPLILRASGTASSITGTTNETALATITIPAGSLGTNGKLRITVEWLWTNSGNNKTLRVRFGGAAGTSYAATVVTTGQSGRGQVIINANNATNAQKGYGSASTLFAPFGSGSAAFITSSVDTTAATTVVISGELATSSETITLESHLVELIPGV